MAMTPQLHILISDLVAVLLSAPVNVFILLVILMDVVNSRSLPINDQLIFGICFFNVLHQVAFIHEGIFSLMNTTGNSFSNSVLKTVNNNVSLAFMLCSIWLNTILSIYFCLKIVNMKHKLYIILQKMFPKIFHNGFVVMVVGSLVLTFFSFLWPSNHGSQKKTFNDNGHQMALTIDNQSLQSKSVIGFLYTVMFLFFCLSVGIITSSLCRHISNIQANPGSSRAISTQAHTHAIVTILCLLIASLFGIITEVIWIASNVYEIPTFALIVPSALHHVSTPLILIRSNRKLQEALQNC
ncbi:taste receptor type 2 member 43-like [Hyperolius riggenbachi]|uniref:taste receptor type 2 member 43-like n=1 Tax=Hyperolius riggenbachi TaxID=752182 RepID=UPI0035A28A69